MRRAEPSSVAGWRPQRRYLVAAVLLLAAGGWWAGSGPSPNVDPPSPPAPTLPVVAAATPASAADGLASPALPPASGASADRSAQLSDDLAAHVPAGQTPSMGEVIQRLNQAGVRSGLGAFSPPGTRPPLIGLAVPDDFELPEGYVRHHQATDDGQRIEPILMFSPDHPRFAGLPASSRDAAQRVVTPEWAPPGMPIRWIVVPPPIATNRP